MKVFCPGYDSVLIDVYEDDINYKVIFKNAHVRKLNIRYV